MAVEERRRIALHRAAAESWGEEIADTLVDLVAPSGHELATREDIRGVLAAIEAMDQRWDERFEAAQVRSDERFEAVRVRLEDAWAHSDERFEAERARADERFEAERARSDERFEAERARADERFEAKRARTDEHLETERLRSDERFAGIEDRWVERFDAAAARAEAMEHRLVATFEQGLRDAITTQTRTLVISQLVAIVVIAGLALGLSG